MNDLIRKLVSMKQAITYRRMPFGIPSKYGTLYGWTLHDWRYPPELETVAFFEKQLTHDDVVADVGANIGYYTLLFSSIAKEVVAFEPSPAYEHLARTVDNRKNVTLVRRGLWSSRTRLPLYADTAGSGLGSVVHRSGDVVTDIEVMRLDEYPKRFTWAKIDVEGAEIEVLRGMNRCKTVVEAAGLLPYIKDVEAMGYKVYAIMDDGIVPFAGTSKNNLYLEPLDV